MYYHFAPSIHRLCFTVQYFLHTLFDYYVIFDIVIIVIPVVQMLQQFFVRELRAIASISSVIFQGGVARLVG